jgi:hypothetical protein
MIRCYNCSALLSPEGTYVHEGKNRCRSCDRKARKESESRNSADEGARAPRRSSWFWH